MGQGASDSPRATPRRDWWAMYLEMVMPFSPSGPGPDQIVDGIAKRQGWRAPSNVLASLLVLLAVATLAVALFALLR